MSTLIVQPSTKDNFLQQNATGDNHGAAPNIAISDLGGSSNIYRAPITFDVSSFSGNSSDITSAEIYLYYHTLAAGVSATGKRVNVYKLRRTDWEEGNKNGAAGISNWINYKTTTAWGTAGAYNTTTDIDTSLTGNANLPAAGNWFKISVKDIVVDAIDNKAGIVDVLVAFDEEDKVSAPVSTFSTVQFYSKNEATQTTLRPKIVINYGAFTAEAGSFTLTGIDVLLGTLLNFVAGVGSFLLTMKDILTKRTKYTFKTKNTTTWTFKNRDH
jgi:hypothetical protein